jgi:hypothetical protein
MSALPIWLGAGKVYVGMSAIRHHASSPPITRTATTTMIATSPQFFAMLVEVNADQLPMPTSWLSPLASSPKVGIVSRSSLAMHRSPGIAKAPDAGVSARCAARSHRE